MQLRVPGFFFLLGGVRVVLDFCCCSHQVLNTFPSHCQISLLSQHVPQSPNVFPTAPAFCATCLLSSWNLYIGDSILRLIGFYVWSEYFYIGGVSQSFITSCWANVAAPKSVAAHRLEPITGSLSPVTWSITCLHYFHWHGIGSGP
jgi:hypothetical protein